MNIHTRTFIIIKHVCRHARMQLNKAKHACNYARQRKAMQSTNTRKELLPFVYLLFTHSHLIVLLKDMAPQHSFKENPQERQGVDWTSRVFINHGAVKTAKAPRGRAGYLSPSW